MSDLPDSNRNPLVIPTERPEPTTRGCPYCGGKDFSARSAEGRMIWNCRLCGGEWHGGVGRFPQDPTVPNPPLDPRDRPTVDFIRNDKTGAIEEVFRRPDYTQSFRRGAPIPSPGDENDG